MSEITLILVLQIKTSKIINDMAQVQQKSEKIRAHMGTVPLSSLALPSSGATRPIMQACWRSLLRPFSQPFGCKGTSFFRYRARFPLKIISVCLSKLKIALWPPGEIPEQARLPVAFRTPDSLWLWVAYSSQSSKPSKLRERASPLPEPMFSLRPALLLNPFTLPDSKCVLCCSCTTFTVGFIYSF